MSRETGQPADFSALSGLASELAEMLVSVACDIALVLDEGGVIRTVALSGTPPVGKSAGDWVGQRWADTLTGEMRQKVEEILRDLADTGRSRTRHLIHPGGAESEVPVAYTAVRLGEQGPTLAIGRDMGLVTAMQERLIQVQQQMERDYWQRREVEGRYRMLFQAATEPALILDAGSFEVVDANRAAAVFLGQPAEQMIGQPAVALIAAEGGELRALLAAARLSNHVAEGEIPLRVAQRRVGVSVTPFKIERTTVLLLVLHTESAAKTPPADALDPAANTDGIFSALVKRTSDAVVICDLQGRVTIANQAFRELVQSPQDETVAGHNLTDWIGRSDGAFQEILGAARSAGLVRLLRTHLRRGNGRLVEIEVSATRLTEPDAIGFIVRVSHQQDQAAAQESPDRGVH